MRHIFNRVFKKQGKLTHPLLANSLPKSGTHLLTNILAEIKRRNKIIDVTDADKFANDGDRLQMLQQECNDISNGDLLIGHIPYSSEIADWIHEKDIKSFFVYRDPRDVLVSLAHYSVKSPNHVYYNMLSELDFDNRLLALINGIGEGKERFEVSTNSIPNIYHYCNVYLDWINHSQTFSTSFEELMNQENYEIVEGMRTFLGLPSKNGAAKEVWEKGSDSKKSPTFRKGKSGGWQEQFQPHHIDAFKQNNGELILEKMGYSTDMEA